MKEADKVADCIAVIDHGAIVALGTSEEFQAKTSTSSPEEAFLSLTGNVIRVETVSSVDRMRS